VKQAALELNLEPWAKKVLNRIPSERRSDVQKFLQHLSDDHKSAKTLRNYLLSIKTLNGTKKPYCQLTEDEMREWARRIDRDYSAGTALLCKCQVKRFIRWIHTGELDGNEYPKCVNWIKLRPGRRSYGREILSQDEVKRLVDVTNNQRDRALLFVAYESGCRASELVNLKIGDVAFDEHSAILRVGKEQGKTGERRIRLFESTPDLQLWLSMNPGKDNPNAPLWPSANFKDKPIGNFGLINLVMKYAKKAGIPKEKKLCPHSFRHSRATHLATVLKEAQMREFFGWTPGSSMPSIYVHLSGRDVDKTLFEHYGIKEPENGNGASPLKKQVCPRCSAENSVTARFCWRCWIAFDTYKADEVTATVMEEFMKRAPELLAAIVKEKGLDQKIAELVPSTEKQVA
jgi:integrase/recombinase XerD